MKAEQITEADAEHGEGPVWSPSWGGLRWVDTFDGDLYTLGDDGTVTKRSLGGSLGALRPRGGVELWTDPGIQFNDGGCDPQGRFYCGSMAVDNTPGGRHPTRRARAARPGSGAGSTRSPTSTSRSSTTSTGARRSGS